METQTTEQPSSNCDESAQPLIELDTPYSFYSELQGHLDAALVEDVKFVAGNGSASTRARKYLQEIILLAKQRRNEITAEKNARTAAKQIKQDIGSAE